MAYPMVSLSYVFGMLAALFVFHEDVSLVRWAGIFFIMLGCILIAR
jgi:undecaprenyl phosphate-alpha-L-ara4N flippase subunit ArnE